MHRQVQVEDKDHSTNFCVCQTRSRDGLPKVPKSGDVHGNGSFLVMSIVCLDHCWIHGVAHCLQRLTTKLRNWEHEISVLHFDITPKVLNGSIQALLLWRWQWKTKDEEEDEEEEGRRDEEEEEEGTGQSIIFIYSDGPSFLRISRGRNPSLHCQRKTSLCSS